MKHHLCRDEDAHDVFSKWVEELLKSVVSSDDDGDGDNDDDTADVAPFQDRIEPGEQGKINGREPDTPVVPLTQLKWGAAEKSWLFEKYYNMNFLDKNPEGADDDPPLLNQDEWERKWKNDILTLT